MKKRVLQLIPWIIGFCVGFFIYCFRARIIFWLQDIWHLLEDLKKIVLVVNNYVVSNKKIVVFSGLLAGFFGIFSKIIISRLQAYVMRMVLKNQFKHSYNIVKKDILPEMDVLISKSPFDKKVVFKNSKIDSYIQSPLKYVNSIIHGNQVPTFQPNTSYAAYQDFLFDENVNYIVVITAENPNMFLDPTIGFFMSNCYATSIIRHINDYINKSNHDIGERLELKTEDLVDFERNVIKPRRDAIIEKLKGEEPLDKFEFIRFFIYDEDQKKSCDNAVFPSLKASQDLFRIFSFYIQKEYLNGFEKNNRVLYKLKKAIWSFLDRFQLVKKKACENEDSVWDKLYKYNKEIWSLFDEFCKDKSESDKQKKERIEKFIPEFVFVFKNEVIEIHTYLGGEYCKVSVELSQANNIKKFIAELANFIQQTPSKSQLYLTQHQKNNKKSFINWKWKAASAALTMDTPKNTT